MFLDPVFQYLTLSNFVVLIFPFLLITIVLYFYDLSLFMFSSHHPFLILLNSSISFEMCSALQEPSDTPVSIFEKDERAILIHCPNIGDYARDNANVQVDQIVHPNHSSRYLY